MSAATLTMATELRQTWRDGRARIAVLATLVLFAVTFAVGWQNQQRHQMDVEAATQADRHIWERQGARNPHSVAHFGQYAFKPAGSLDAFDPGFTPWLGTALWIEAHYQNTASFRPIEDQDTPPITTSLSAAFVLQYLAPLLLIFLGHGLVARERERQTLKLGLSNGASVSAWIGGKFLALAVLAGILWLPSLWPILSAASDEIRMRASALALAYGIYLLMLCCLVLAVSAWARSARGALVILLCAWATMALVLPRVTSTIAERVAPSADAGAFWRDIRAALRHAGEERERELLARTLARYGVSREEDLPVSFAGVALQAGEEHGNEVFDRFYERLQAEEARQLEVLRAGSVITPWLALRRLSAGLAGTDSDHHWHFVRATESYRRDLQRYLNGDLERNAAGVDDYRADPSLWRNTATFAYSSPTLRELIGKYTTDASLLLAWLAASIAALATAARRLMREGAMA